MDALEYPQRITDAVLECFSDVIPKPKAQLFKVIQGGKSTPPAQPKTIEEVFRGIADEAEVVIPSLACDAMLRGDRLTIPAAYRAAMHLSQGGKVRLIYGKQWIRLLPDATQPLVTGLAYPERHCKGESKAEAFLNKEFASFERKRAAADLEAFHQAHVVAVSGRGEIRIPGLHARLGWKDGDRIRIQLDGTCLNLIQVTR